MPDVNFSRLASGLAGKLTLTLCATKMKTITQIVTIGTLLNLVSGKLQASNNHIWLPISTLFLTGTIPPPKNVSRYLINHFFGKTLCTTYHQSIIAANSIKASIYNIDHFKNKSSWTFNKSGRVIGATFQAPHSNVTILLQIITINPTSSFKTIPSILKVYLSVPTVSEVSTFTSHTRHFNAQGLCKWYILLVSMIIAYYIH